MSKIVYRGKKAPETALSDGAEAEEQSESVKPVEDSPAAEAESEKAAEAVEAEALTAKKPARTRSAKPKPATESTVEDKAEAVTEEKPAEDTAEAVETAESADAPKPVKAKRKKTAEELSDKAEQEIAATAEVIDGGESAEASVNTEAPEGETEPPQETFDKAKIVKYFKRHPKMTINTKVDRFTPELNEGLSPEQVETRFKQYLFNDTNKKYSKSYASIFIGNICTFFNLHNELLRYRHYRREYRHRYRTGNPFQARHRQAVHNGDGDNESPTGRRGFGNSYHRGCA